MSTSRTATSRTATHRTATSRGATGRTPSSRRTDPTTGRAGPATRWRARGRLALHYVEMVVAMMVAMVVLAPVSDLSWGLVGVDLDQPRWAVVAGLVMAIDMTVGMAAWMLVRRHGRRHVVDMSAAMLLPAAVVAALELAGVLGHGTGGVVSHVGMLVAMAVVVLRHPRG